MNYKDLRNKIKEEQKNLAQQIKNGKTGRKPNNRRSDNLTDWKRLSNNQFTYRHKHIAYCKMFYGTPYEAIEQPRDENRPNSYILENYRKEWESQLDEVVCDCA